MGKSVADSLSWKVFFKEAIKFPSAQFAKNYCRLKKKKKTEEITQFITFGIPLVIRWVSELQNVQTRDLSPNEITTWSSFPDRWYKKMDPRKDIYVDCHQSFSLKAKIRVILNQELNPFLVLNRSSTNGVKLTLFRLTAFWLLAELRSNG